MSALEQTKAILETIRADLKREKEAVVAIVKDPRVAEWQTIDLKENQALLTAVGINPIEIGEALANYPKQAQKIGKQIVEWGNEVGNQLADLIGQPKPDVVLAAAHRLEEKSKALAAMHQELLASTNRFVMADQTLRQQLSLKPMLVIAKSLNTSKKDILDGGLMTLAMLVADIGQKDGERTLGEICKEPAMLAARFQRLDVTKLPRIVEEILFHHIEEAVTACKEIGLYLENGNERLARELEWIGTIEEDLKALQSAKTAALLSGISQQATIIGKLITALYQKRQLKEMMATVSEALELLKIFHSLLKNKLAPGLQKEVELPGSALNPITSATTMTRSFFTGATGMIRSIKLMMTSLTGKSAINEVELQLILEKGIANCKTFCGKTPADLKAMKDYIDRLVGQYPKPFPYNDLFKLTRATLSAYGEEVESFLQKYKVPKDMLPITTGVAPAKLGKLIAAIAKHKNAFKKANDGEQ